jgi:hypothetical protein
VFNEEHRVNKIYVHMVLCVVRPYLHLGIWDIVLRMMHDSYLVEAVEEEDS